MTPDSSPTVFERIRQIQSVRIRWGEDFTVPLQPNAKFLCAGLYLIFFLVDPDEPPVPTTFLSKNQKDLFDATNLEFIDRSQHMFLFRKLP